jgi:hypothetical protein
MILLTRRNWLFFVLGLVSVTGVAAPAEPQAQDQQQSNPQDVTAFSTFANSELAQLHSGVTLGQWLDLHKSEGWEASTDEAFLDCRTFAKTERLPSGRTITRLAYFFPPEAPTPAVFPTSSGQELVNRDCTLAMVRVQAPAPSQGDGQGFERAFQQQFAQKYGNSIGMKGTRYPDSADAAHWKAGSLEIIAVYDTSYLSDVPTAQTVFVSAHLPVVHEIEQNSCCRMKEFRYRSIENAQFQRALPLPIMSRSFLRPFFTKQPFRNSQKQPS